MNRWTDEEKVILSDTTKTVAELHKLLPNRSRLSIESKTRKLGYKRPVSLKTSKNYQELIKNVLFCETIDGEMLGDGCIVKQGNNYTFAYCTSNEEYARYLHAYISEHTRSKSVIYVRNPPKPHMNPNGRLVVSSTSYQFRICHKVFKYFYNRWYNPLKKVPENIKLTPTTCSHWYIGDGTISNKKSLIISLSTECFTKHCIDLLVENLKKAGIKSKFYKNSKDQYIIRIFAQEALRFLEYIKPCPVDSYDYKWNTNGYQKRTNICFCGQEFHFFGHTDRKIYCSESCRQKHKRLKYNKKLSDMKKNDLSNNAMTISDNSDFYYILGHVLCSGKIISKSVISIKINDHDLVSFICNKLNCTDKFNLYNNTLSFRSNEMIDLFKILVINFDLSGISSKYHGDLLRGIFDSSGMINLASDNGFQIILRYRLAEVLSKMIGIENSSSSMIRIKKCHREMVFNKMYIHSDEIRSKKKYDLFKRSVNRSRIITPKDKKGRFISSK